MKTAVSIPDDVFAEAENLARGLKTSRSDLFCRALKEFLARHAPDAVTEALNRTCESLDFPASEDLTRKAAARVLERSEW